MELNKQISRVVGLNDYIELTQNFNDILKDVEIPFNMSTLISLKKIRSLEIEYFNKCDGNGAAITLLERILSSPPTKTWGLLGAEVVETIRYWLDAVRKHLISHHVHWWTFLRQILHFIKEVRQKDNRLSSHMVEELAESMLDLATSGKPDVNQRYEILHTFNLFCAESTREVRLGLRAQFEPYFIRLATIMATCGHLPAQFASLETLLRWLQPRHDPATRRDAAGKWLLPHLYPQGAVDVFLNRTWMNFYQDARDFLNCHNVTNEMVTSVICRKLSVGSVVIISGEERRQTWLDINTGSDSLTVLLEPQLLEALGVDNPCSCETLVVHSHHAELVKLSRESTEVTLTVHSACPPRVEPGGAGGAGGAALFVQPHHVTAVLSSRSNIPRVDRALRNVFQDKYQVLLDVDNVPLSPPRVEAVPRKNSMMQENPRFSHVNPPREKRRPPKVGFMSWGKRFATLKSPSSTSTGSLAQLPDKLRNLPYYEFTKEPVSVCAKPDLSVVSEASERSEQPSSSYDSNKTLKLYRCAVPTARVERNKAKSDTESASSKVLKNIQDVEDRSSKGSQSDKYVQKNKPNERNVSLLFCATLGSADNSVIDAAIERLPKDKEITTDSLTELLLQEALQATADREDRQSDSGINTENGKSQEQVILDSETIEETQYTGPTTRAKTPAGISNNKGKTAKKRKKSTSDESKSESVKKLGNGAKTSSNKIVSKSTSDESNTSVIEPTINYKAKTPNKKIVSKSTSDESNTDPINEPEVSFVSVRKRNPQQKCDKKKETVTSDETSSKNNEVEDFFSQHFAERQMVENLLSPTLAKKINESSSSSSDDFLSIHGVDKNLDIIRNEELPDLDIVECLNDIVDKVCSDFKKCTEYLDKDGAHTEILVNMAKNRKTKENSPLEEKDTSTGDTKTKETRKPAKNTKSKGKQSIKLKYPTKKQKAQPKAKGKLKLEPVSKMSTILEVNSENEANKTTASYSKEITDDRINDGKTKALLAATTTSYPIEIADDRINDGKTKALLAATTSSYSKEIADDRINEGQMLTPVVAKISTGTTTTPLTRNASAKRKRKLYSPKDDEIAFEAAYIEDTVNRINEGQMKTPLVAKISTETTITPPPNASEKRKRKLYSPKDDEIQFEVAHIKNTSNNPDNIPIDSEDDTVLSELKTTEHITPKVPKPPTSCYKEIEIEKKKHRRIRARKSMNRELAPSPKTMQLNDVFEKLKDNVEVHENIILVDKKSHKDIAIFNYTSDSEDEDFKQKKIEVQKRTSTTTLGSSTSVMSTRRGRPRKTPNKFKDYLDDENDSVNKTKKSVQRKRAPRRKQSKAKTVSPELKVDRPTDLVDEKMREALPEEINTSFIEATVDDNVKEPEPAIKSPELEVIPDENANFDVEDCKERMIEKKTEKELNKEVTKKETKITKKQNEKKPTKMDKNVAKNREVVTKLIDFTKDDDDRTVSPLPGLVIESEIDRDKLDDSITTNVVQKLQKMYKDGPDALNDTTTTQNMLSENEKPISSPNTNITEEMGKIFGVSQIFQKNSIKNIDLENKENCDVDIIDETVNSDRMSNISAVEGSKTKPHSSRLRLKRKNQCEWSADTSSAKKDNAAQILKIKLERHQIEESQKSKTKSQIEEINYNEIICLDTETDTDAKRDRSQYCNKNTEIIDIAAGSDGNSEKSISSDGITGHGDINELPPSPKLLEKNILPREIQDMDPAMRKYYIELSNKVYELSNSIESESKKTEEKLKAKSKQREEEDSDSEPEQKSEKGIKFSGHKYDIEEMLPSRRDTESSSQISKGALSVSVRRLSSKELSKWMPSTKTTPETSFISAQKKETLRRGSKLAKDTTVESSIGTAEKTAETLEATPKKVKNMKFRTSKNTISKETTESSFEAAEKSQETPATSTKVVKNRKSQISPIRFDDFIPKPKKGRKVFNISSEKDETIDTQEVEIESEPKKYFLRSTRESTPMSRAPSEEYIPKTLKRKSPIPEVIKPRRRKLDKDFKVETIDEAKKCIQEKLLRVELIDISRSSQSFKVDDIPRSKQSSNVEDWLRNILSTSKVNKFDASKDVLQNVLEKIDTTLPEIHQNTTKNFMSLFTEARQKAETMKEERQQQIRSAGGSVLAAAVSQLNSALCDIARVLDRELARVDRQ
ncbi:hypothetical protein O0L34_g3606 [Tuta absoluta]|nr:hypothetical protein O0L34_g3606 [Tuta absoluta]